MFILLSPAVTSAYSGKILEYQFLSFIFNVQVGYALFYFLFAQYNGDAIGKVLIRGIEVGGESEGGNPAANFWAMMAQSQSSGNGQIWPSQNYSEK